MLANETKEYLEIFIRIVLRLRPEITGSDYLFTTYDGSTLIQLGRQYQAFMRKELGIRFGTTSSRSMLDTDVHSAYVKGVINLEHKEACTLYNGHTTATSRQYYQRCVPITCSLTWHYCSTIYIGIALVI